MGVDVAYCEQNLLRYVVLSRRLFELLFQRRVRLCQGAAGAHGREQNRAGEPGPAQFQEVSTIHQSGRSYRAFRPHCPSLPMLLFACSELLSAVWGYNFSVLWDSRNYTALCVRGGVIASRASGAVPFLRLRQRGVHL
jgi:hypothetical protein